MADEHICLLCTCTMETDLHVCLRRWYFALSEKRANLSYLTALSLSLSELLMEKDVCPKCSNVMSIRSVSIWKPSKNTYCELNIFAVTSCIRPNRTYLSHIRILSRNYHCE